MSAPIARANTYEQESAMKKITKLVAAFSVAAAVAPMQAQAATQGIPFNGSVSSTCVITLTGNGVLGASADFSTLASTEAGGAAGTATVVTNNSSFGLSADAPTSWDSAPATGGNNVSFAAAYSSAGATTASNVAGTTITSLNQGTHTVSIDMSAVKTVGETFESGTYAATVVLRCE